MHHACEKKGHLVCRFIKTLYLDNQQSIHAALYLVFVQIWLAMGTRSPFLVRQSLMNTLGTPNWELILGSYSPFLIDCKFLYNLSLILIFSFYQGLWDTQNAGTSIDDLEEYSDFKRPERSSQSSRGFRGQKFHPRTREIDNDWELPMDYL